MNLTTSASRTKAYRFGVMLLLTLLIFLLTGAAWYSTTKFGSRPVGAQAGTFAPFLNIVPSDDGNELLISAGNVGEVSGAVFANISLGPGHRKGGTMVYSDTVNGYITTLTPGFTPSQGQAGTLNITTSLGLDTGVAEFNRAYIPASTAQLVASEDGNLRLNLFTDTIPFDTYMVVVPSYAPPGQPPLDHEFVGHSYTVRAAGALLVTDKPMGLRLYYNDTTLAGADPHMLAIFAWDGYYQQWNNLGGDPFFSQQYLATPTSRFTTYVLMATPAWKDEFDDYDFSGLNFPAEVSNIERGGTSENGTLILSNGALSGTAISKPIIPPHLHRWGNLSFNRLVSSPGMTLTVDILSLAGVELMTNVADGASLSALNPIQYPGLKLRANLSSTTPGQTPALDNWQLTWQAKESVYLPLVLKQK
jgi:hypothetical protein